MNRRLPLVLSLLGACAEDVPSPTLVEDLRVLAIKAEPPELLFERGDEGPRTVSFEALVVDPRGLPMTFQWSFCPVESNQTCADFEPRRARAQAALHPVLDAARAQARPGEAAAGTTAVEPFVAEVTPALFGFHLADSGLGLGNGAWVSAVLSVGTGTDRLTAQKRLVLNARDLSQWNPELAGAGWQVCPPAPAEPPANCLPLAPRTANRNPQIVGLEVARAAVAGTPFEPLESALMMTPGQTVRLRPRLADDAVESFQVVESSLAGNHLVVVNRTEEPVVSWFATGGEMGEEQTAPQLTKTLDNTFTAPATPGPVSVFVVVRDQRGGTGWTRLEVQVVAP